MKAFVVGAGGYIGASLVKTLMARGYEVRGLVKNPARLRNLTDVGADAVLGDIRHPESLRGLFDGVDVVFHLVGVIVGSEEEIFLTNVEGAKNAADAALAAGVEKFVFASSCAVYGDHGDSLVTEETDCRPATAYGISKLEAERVVGETAGREMPYAICRLGGVYGPRSQMLMLQSGGRMHVRFLGEGKNWISPIHVEDAAEALIAVAERGRSGEVYNAADDDPVRLKEFYTYLAHQLGEPEAKHISEATAKRMARIAGFFGRITGKTVVFNADFVKMIFSSLRVSNEKMRRELGVALKYPTFKIGIDAVLKELRASAAAG